MANTVMVSLLHVDLVSNDWGHMRQVQVGRVVVEQTEGESVGQHVAKDYLDVLAVKWGGGSYRFLTDPHTDDDCPFKVGPVVAMKHVTTPVTRHHIGSSDEGSDSTPQGQK